MPPLRFRPHHFLCALGYQGKGYSQAFTRNMDAIVAGRLRGPQGAQVEIRVVGATDDICGPCPHRRGPSCDNQVKIATLDARHAVALRLSIGQTLSWGEAQTRMVDHVPPDALSAICAGCQWLEYGMCTAALAALHQQAGPRVLQRHDVDRMGACTFAPQNGKEADR